MNSKNNTLVILTPGFPKNEADSTCLPAVQNFVNVINTQFPLVRIVVLAFDYPYVSATWQWNRNTVTGFNGFKKRKFKKIFKWISIWRKLNELKRKNNVIGLLSFWCGECAYIGNRYAKINRLKHYCWIMGQDAKKENSYVNRIKPSAGELIAMSDFLADEFFSNHAIRPALVIPNGIDPRAFNKTNTERDIDILGVGSLIPLKQYEVFISIIKEIQKYLPNIKVVLCGKGPEEETLKDLINEHELSDNISMVGELEHGKALRLMQHSKILLHPSAYEGFSTVCLEALYAGAHVISFCRAMKANIDHWYIVNSKEEMKEKILELLQNPGTAYISVSLFPMDDTAKKMMELFSA